MTLRQRTQTFTPLNLTRLVFKIVEWRLSSNTLWIFDQLRHQLKPFILDVVLLITENLRQFNCQYQTQRFFLIESTYF